MTEARGSAKQPFVEHSMLWLHPTGKRRHALVDRSFSRDSVVFQNGPFT